MVDVAITPEAVDALANRLNEKATEAIALRKRAQALGAGSILDGLGAVTVWAEGTAQALTSLPGPDLKVSPHSAHSAAVDGVGPWQLHRRELAA